MKDFYISGTCFGGKTTLSQVEKISNGNNNNGIGINKIVNGSKEVMEAGDAAT